MADKPIIATPRGEWDARSLVLADQAPVTVWPDVSGAGNDMNATGGIATYQAVGGAGAPWSDTLPAVRMDDSPANDQFGGVGNFGGAGSAFTLFAVAEATDLLQSGMAFWGSLDGTIIPTGPLGIYLFIGTDGAVGLVIGAINVTLLLSPPGLVSEGDRVIITARRIATQGPALLRVNGVEVSSSSNSGLVGSWPSKRMHRCNLQSNFGFPGDIEGADGLYAHLIEYGSAASDEEILQMEAFLEEVWFPGPWVPSGKQFDFTPPVPAVKPDIADAEVEYDARTLPLILNDGDPVVTWADQSGNGNDAVDAPAPAEQPTLRLDRWAPGSGIPSVEFLDFGAGPPSREEAMDYDAQTPYRGSELTIFIVGRIIDLSEGGAFIGTRTGATPPREIDVCVFPTGEILFGFGTETIPTAVQTNIITAPGTVKEGEKLLITVRSTGGSAGVNPEGMLIRLNGQQVASVPSFVTPPNNVVGAGGIQQGAIGRSQNTGSPELGLPGGTIWGTDRLIAWIGGYSGAATNDEILEMERFLHDTFGFDFLRTWTPQAAPSTSWEPTVQQLIPGGPKPLIANPEIEFDVRTLVLNDGDTVLIWPDTSGQGNDANAQAGLDPSFIVDGWTLGIPSVRMQDVPGDENENFQFSGEPEFVGTEVTFFLVFRVDDLSDGAAILGSSNGATPPRIWDLSVDSDGTIFFNHQEIPRLIDSAPGTIVEGEMYVVTGRMSNTLGMILRVNGVEVGRNIEAVAKENIISYPNARIGQSRDLKVGDTEYGKDRSIVWASGYSSAASDDEIGEMESFLAGVFQFNFGTEWVPS